MIRPCRATTVLVRGVSHRSRRRRARGRGRRPRRTGRGDVDSYTFDVPTPHCGSPARATVGDHEPTGTRCRRDEARVSRSRSKRSSFPTPGPARPWSRSRPAGCATPTCTTARAASTTTSRSCSATRRRASSKSVGEGVTDVAPGDYVILNWRAVCGDCRACRRGQTVVLLQHAQRHPEDDAARRHRAVAGARHRRVRRQDARRRRPVHEGRPGGAGHRGRTARLRRDGRHRRGDQHRRRRRGRLGRRVRLRRRRRRGDRRFRLAGRIDDHRRRHRRPQARDGRRSFGATHTCNSATTDPVEYIKSSHRRLRRRRVHRGGRQPGGVPPGVRGPRPRRHRGARRRAPTRHDHRTAVHRGVRARRRAEVVVVRRLPPDRGTSRC